LLNNLPPALYEDGEQTRDFSFAGDIAHANLLAASTDILDGRAVNVGSGKAVTIRRIAEVVSGALGIKLSPVLNGEFRPGEMRHLISDTRLIQRAGYRPSVDIEEGINRYVDWIRSQGDVKDYFGSAERILRQKGILHKIQPMAA
jgi:dTDP-L-rhamnose 4-epimerase